MRNASTSLFQVKAAILFRVTRIGAREDAPSGFAFSLTTRQKCLIIKMSYYSIAVAAQELEVQRQTIYSWIAKGYIPGPHAGLIAGSRREFWTEEEMNQIR